MATEDQYIRAKRGAGDPSCRAIARLFQTVTVAANATYSGTFVVPEGSHLGSIQAEVAAALAGTPTSANLRVGSAAAGQQVVADVDVKAQGHFNTTIVATFDKITGLSTYYWQLVVAGGTSPTGVVTLILDYWPPGLS